MTQPVFRITAILSGRIKKTYLSGADNAFDAVRSLEALLREQSYSFRTVKVERAFI